MEAKSLQSQFEKNIHLFDAAAPAKNAVLLFHAINQSAGLKCNGLLESDPVSEGTILFNEKVTNFRVCSQIARFLGKL